ncbi:beta-ketoacyl-[acyl-carrier-protein] synthase family protein [Streptomyces sp. NPDC051684]|uniref:beta-ketoacyl-[acyl-carrier-protein] synthase family protein n=1 Tax=Streptomyces sp. NPDC051684 TaxID=3365670 RepID=UPI0037A0D92C
MNAAASITGIGLVTPAGIGVEDNWSAVAAGRSAAARDPQLAGLATDFSCRIPGFDADALLGRRTAWRLDPFTRYAMVAARQAVEDAGLDTRSWDGARVGVVLGNSLGGTHTLEEQTGRFLQDGPDEVSALTVPKSMVNMVAGYVAMDLGILGPSLVTATACASGATALGVARSLLVSGQCDIVLAGGTEAALTPATVTGLSRMGALSERREDPQRASRPFCAHRDGFVPGEGAAVLVLEAPGHARARRASAYADLVGFGASSDAHHATQPHPEGQGLVRAAQDALRDAGALPDEIGHVNAHGTSTPLNDSTEARALRKVFGTGPAVTSTKGVTGHTLAAAGAIEAAYTALALHHQTVPPTANVERLDAEVDIDVVTGQARPTRMELAMSTSLGFGGHNAALVLRAA